MQIQIKMGEILLGYLDTELAKTDPPMGCGEAPFHPSSHYPIVEELFRQQSEYTGFIGVRNEAGLNAINEKISALNLLLAAANGEVINVSGFAILDFRIELPDEPLTFQFFGMHHEQFERLFPGHFAAYESSFANA